MLSGTEDFRLNVLMVICSLLQQQSFPEGPPPYQQQQYYQGYPSYPPYPYPQQKSSGGGLPFYVWIGVGALVMWAYSKISSLVRGGPQAAQAKMMSWVSRPWVPLPCVHGSCAMSPCLMSSPCATDSLHLLC